MPKPFTSVMSAVQIWAQQGQVIGAVLMAQRRPKPGHAIAKRTVSGMLAAHEPGK